MILPGPRLLPALAIWCVLGLPCAASPVIFTIWTGAGLLLGAAAAGDLAATMLRRRVKAERRVDGRMAVGVEHEVEITLTNTNRKALKVRMTDAIPDRLESADFPWTGAIPGSGHTMVAARVRPSSRGEAHFGLIHLEEISPLGFWARRHRSGAPSVTLVYPDYGPVLRLALLAMSHRESQMGIRKRNRPGMSREFRQLRDYQDGDTLSRVDWKATSRALHLVSRDYEEQRNQTVILAIDCGRRLSARDGELAQFDHCLNAALLVAYIALKQGDQVGVMAFGGSRRWLPPVKGSGAMPVILNHLYDYETTGAPGDFSEAAEDLLTRVKRRAMVIFCTNLRDGDGEHLTTPLRLVRARHLTVVASLREREVMDSLEKPVTSLRDAWRHAGAARYLAGRAQVLETLRAGGVITLDSPADTLPVALGNLYLDIKQQGLL